MYAPHIFPWNPCPVLKYGFVLVFLYTMVWYVCILGYNAVVKYGIIRIQNTEIQGKICDHKGLPISFNGDNSNHIGLKRIIVIT